jgi:2-polyprenyl-6-methoxyphenol hydroxylase-like FAD-dependent oxidoreductase
MKQSLSIAIVGAGPGGLATALLLKRRGHDIRVFERFAPG